MYHNDIIVVNSENNYVIIILLIVFKLTEIDHQFIDAVITFLK